MSRIPRSVCKTSVYSTRGVFFGVVTFFLCGLFCDPKVPFFQRDFFLRTVFFCNRFFIWAIRSRTVSTYITRLSERSFLNILSRRGVATHGEIPSQSHRFSSPAPMRENHD